jgi:hypothetical protein
MKNINRQQDLNKLRLGNARSGTCALSMIMGIDLIDAMNLVGLSVIGDGKESLPNEATRMLAHSASSENAVDKAGNTRC